MEVITKKDDVLGTKLISLTRVFELNDKDEQVKAEIDPSCIEGVFGASSKAVARGAASRIVMKSGYNFTVAEQVYDVVSKRKEALGIVDFSNFIKEDDEGAALRTISLTRVFDTLRDGVEEVVAAILPSQIECMFGASEDAQEIGASSQVIMKSGYTFYARQSAQEVKKMRDEALGLKP